MKIHLLSVLLVFTLVEVFAVFSHELVSENDGEVVLYRTTRGIRDRKKAGECRYKKSAWEECDSVTNTERRTLTLKRGDSTCEQTKVLTRKCKKACKYEKGDWNDCEINTNTRTRTDTLKPKSDANCEATRTISKKCKKVCRYSKQATWTECDPNIGMKTKVLALTSGDPSFCEANKKITKRCRNGKKGGKGKQAEDDDADYENDK